MPIINTQEHHKHPRVQKDKYFCCQVWVRGSWRLMGRLLPPGSWIGVCLVYWVSVRQTEAVTLVPQGETTTTAVNAQVKLVRFVSKQPRIIHEGHSENNIGITYTNSVCLHNNYLLILQTNTTC